MNLTPNFTLEEFLVSQTAQRHGIDMTPSPQIITNLQRLCVHVLQPLRDHVGSAIFVSSGYRPLELNTRIGGSTTSAHLLGNAADIKVVGQTPYETAQTIVELGLPVDQVIHEFGRWVHVGMADSARGEQLTAFRNTRGKTEYAFGIKTMEEVGAVA